MKKFLCSLLVTVLTLSLGACAFGADYWTEHGGTESDPYVIDSTADLIALRNRVYDGTEGEGLYYELTTNISLKNVNWKEYDSGSSYKSTIGRSTHPFMGHFDGKGHTIECDKGVALFGTIKTESGYAVKNLTVSGSFSATLEQSAAGIALSLYNASIENCTFTGTVNASGNRSNSRELDAYAGGIVKEMFSGTIKNCTLKAATIKAYAVSGGEGNTGGIVARMSGGIIENCTVDENCVITGKGKYYSIDTSTYYNVPYSNGGIVGLLNKSNGILNSGNVKNNTCKAQVEVASDGYVYLGGIVGEIRDSNISVEGNTYEGDISANTIDHRIGTITIGGIIGKMGVSSPTISNNRYSGATYGIGADAGGMGSDTGCSKISTDTDNKDSDNKDKDNTDTDNKDSDNKDKDNTDTDNKDSDNKDKDNTDTDNKDSDNKDSDNKDTGDKDTGDKDTGNKTDTDTDNKDNGGGTGTDETTQNNSTGSPIDEATQKKVAEKFNVNVNTINFITKADIRDVTAPSDNVKEAVKSNDFEISDSLTAINVTKAGQQALKVALPGGVQGKNISDVKIYFVNKAVASLNSVNTATLPSGMTEGVLLDSNGNKITTTISSTSAIASANLESVGEYNVYLAEKKADSSSPSSDPEGTNGTEGTGGSGSGGGCNAGFGIMTLAAVLAIFKKK